MQRGDASDDFPLEVIDLEPEIAPRPAPTERSPRRRTAVVAGAAAIVVVIAAAVIVSSHKDPAPQEPDETVGRFHPAVDGSDRAELVLPSGVRIVLNGDLQRIIGGLGATYTGGLGSVGYRIVHADPSQLFRSLGPDEIPSAVAAAGADARVPGIGDLGSRLAVVSTGGWTLVAFLGDSLGLANAQLDEVADWELRPTPNGAVVVAPQGAVGESSVVLESAAGGERRIEFTADNCAGTSVRTESQLGRVTLGRWCVDGVYVRITGPAPYVEHALEVFQVRVGVADTRN